ncbi:unnamed protein product [Tuber melanosporum]|uniref:(Perigord truffle) hypothetical protein n=1 Tax=Tuber melanosporum (strain Mel28) TaxID=656061 RepID=D5GAT6_TUBMM|nr:uncharacterized protein GSTUM_00005300001 [Tuber melanosporum]CAZ81629.1 unnamed protein product [Tuber melanosporum]
MNSSSTSSESFRVQQDNTEDPPYDLSSNTPLEAFQVPLTILEDQEDNMNNSTLSPLEEMSDQSESPIQQTSLDLESTSKSPDTFYQFTKFPQEIQEKVIEEYIQLLSPNLSIIKDQAQIPITQDLNQQAESSQLLNHTIAYELENSLHNILLVSKAMYKMVAGYMTRNAVYIDGPFNLQRLLLFEKRQRKDWSNEIPTQKPIINRPTKIYPFGVTYSFTNENCGDVTGLAPGKIAESPYHFDSYGAGPWWKRPDSHDSNELMAQIYENDEEHGDWNWLNIPGWVRGGSYNIGGHLNLSDGSIDDNKSIKDYGSVEDSGDSDDRSQMEVDCGDGLNKGDYEPGSFLTHAKTLILGPGASEMHESDIPHYVSSLSRGQDTEMVAVYYRIPATHLLSKMFGRLDNLASLKKLVISGHIWSNPWLFVPRPVDSDLRFPNLTHLTLSLPFAAHKEASPLRSLRYFRERSADRHLCMLLTGRYRIPGGVVIENGSTFLNTLEYLHVRGPGAHCCSQLWKGCWKKLNSIIIELPTTAAICEPGTENLISAIKDNFLNRLPKAEVQVNLRTILPWFDSHFGHYFWRRMKDRIISTESYPGEALPLAHSPSGINVVLFSKSNEEHTIIQAHPDWLAAINNIQHEEKLHANGTIEYFKNRDGVDAMEMVWEQDHIWITAENHINTPAPAEENPGASEDTATVAPYQSGSPYLANVLKKEKGEPDYSTLIHAADDEFLRQEHEYLEHIANALKKGHTPGLP